MYLPEIRVTDFNDEAAGKFRLQVLEHAMNYPSDPIRVYIDSSGGDIDALASMVATMESVPNLIHTICLGKAYSCGALLLSLGDIRTASPYSTVMIHEISAGAFGTATTMENNMTEIKRQNKLWITRFAKSCKKTYNEVVKLMSNRDVYFTNKQAKKFGIVDRTRLPKPEFKLMKKFFNPHEPAKEENNLGNPFADGAII